MNINFHELILAPNTDLNKAFHYDAKLEQSGYSNFSIIV